MTSRYVRDSITHGAARDRCSESELVYILDRIRSTRRSNLDKRSRFRLVGEDMKESNELCRMIVEALAFGICHILPGAGVHDDSSLLSKEIKGVVGKGMSHQRSHGYRDVSY